MTSKREINWTLGSGKQIVVQISVTRTHVTERELDADGIKMRVSADDVTKSQTVTAIVDDAIIDTAYMGMINRAIAPNNQGVVASIGRKVGLTDETLKLVEDAISDAAAEAESAPEIADCLSRIATREEARRKGAAEYDQHREMMRNVMGY